MKNYTMFNRLEDLKCLVSRIRNHTSCCVEDEDTAADLCDALDHCLVKIERCLESIHDEARK